MKRLPAAALLTTIALAQQLPAQQSSLNTYLDTGAAPSARTGVTSMDFELRDNLVKLPVIINDKPQTAVLDSGAGAIVVDDKAAAQLKLDAANPDGEVAGAGAQAQQLRPINLASMSVGLLHFEKMAGYAVNLEQLSSSAGYPINVLLGAPVFKDHVVTVDYKHKRLTFAASGKGPACSRPIPMEFVHDIPVVVAELRPTPGAAPVRLRLLVDLGTRHHAVLLGGAFARSEAGKALVQAGVQQQVGHGTGGAVQGSVAQTAELRVGAHRIVEPQVALTSGVGAFDAAGVDGSLGAPLWKEGSITFDYQAKQLCLPSLPR